jgi:outer membrane protein assembly factor BamA
MRAITPTAVRSTTIWSVLLRIGFSVTALCLCMLAAALPPNVARAGIDSDLSLERYVTDGLPARASRAMPADREKRKTLPFTILPQVGYGPDTGAKAGVKFEGRDLFDGNTFADVNVIYAQQEQAKGTFTIGNNRMFDSFMYYATANYYRDPSKEFFGLGNNEVGSEELADYDIKRVRIGGTFAYRVLRRVAITLSAMYRESDVDPAKNTHDRPNLQRFAPTLPGVHGAESNYVGVAIVYNSRDEVVRPTRGWELVAKYLSADKALFNRDTDYSKFILDTSYTMPLVWRRQVLAVHGNTEVIFGHRRNIPFFELSSLGGDDSMRGYFPERFLGKGRVLFNVEYRLKLLDFNLRKLWDVTVDGVAFGDAGRVYNDADDFLHHFADHLRYSYGGGTRIGFSSGLVARIDVGFSEEKKGLVYLTFGHTF